MRHARCVAFLAALAAAVSPAGAVVLNPRGIGQVLVYPYYTVNGGNSTLFSVVNTTANGKALKVRFLEGYNSRDVADFNLYLAPFDVWTGQTVITGADRFEAAALATFDTSCTVPEFGVTFGFEVHTLPFSPQAYAGPNGDGGSALPLRTEEGFVEIIEMGEVTNARQNTLDAITHDAAGEPADCAQLVQAWAGGGYWTTDATIDLSAPAGGLYGAESIINIAEGTLYAVDAVAIDGFSDVVQHSAPGSAAPDLNTASRNAGGIVSAFVPVGASSVRADYDKPEDAISALFMSESVLNEYVIDTGVGAQSDWIVTFPTKRFYTDRALLGDEQQARAPFDEIFGRNGYSCSQVYAQLITREVFVRFDGGCSGLGIQCLFSLCYSVNSVPFGVANSVFASRLTEAEPFDPHYLGVTAGQVLVSFTRDSDGYPVERHALNSINGLTLEGLPAIGFLAVDYINSDAKPGTLANYSGAYPHRSTVACATTAQPAQPCP